MVPRKDAFVCMCAERGVGCDGWGCGGWGWVRGGGGGKREGEVDEGFLAVVLG